MEELIAQAVLTPRGEVRSGLVQVSDGRVVSVETSDGGAPGVLAPGFVDIQCNGAEGADLSDATAGAFDRVARTLLSSGTTSWCPTLPSAAEDTYPRFLDAAADARERPGPRLLGVHLEGPFLNPVRAGAHPPEHLRAPDPRWLERLCGLHPGLIRIVTLAPELPGSLDVIRFCVDRGIVAAVGHSDATEDEAMAAFDAGATLLTHVYNAMRPIHHRDVGVGGAALGRPDVRCSLICDGQHVHPAVAAFTARGLGAERTVLVSDAVASPTPAPLSGGFTLLDGCVANLVAWGVPMADAVRMASTTPADLLGVGDVGRLEAGAFADAALWRDGRVARVWFGGEPVETEGISPQAEKDEPQG